MAEKSNKLTWIDWVIISVVAIVVGLLIRSDHPRKNAIAEAELLEKQQENSFYIEQNNEKFGRVIDSTLNVVCYTRRDVSALSCVKL